MRRQFNWSKIRQLRQAGHSAYAIAQEPSMPTRQAISQRENKEGWQLEGEPIVRQAQQLGLCNNDNKAAVLSQLARGTSYRLAADSIGIKDRTLRQWRQDDPDFAAACRAAKSCLLTDMVAVVVEAARRGDYKAAVWLLEHSEESRRDFRAEDRNEEPVQVNILINRGD